MKNKLKDYVRDVGILRLFLLAVGAIVVYKILFDFDTVMHWIGRIMHILSPFTTGFMIAYFANIPCGWLQKKLSGIKVKWVSKIAKPVSIVCIYSIMVLLMIFAVGTLVPMVYENITQFIASLPVYVGDFVLFLQDLPSFGILEFDLWVNSFIEAKPWNAWLSELSSFSLTDSFNYVKGFFSGLFNIVLALISSVYFLIEYDRIKTTLKRFVGLITNEKKRNSVLKYLRLVDGGIRKFITCQLLDSLIIGTITTIEFFILKSPYALLLGLILAVANIVPYFGSIIGTIVAVLIMGLTNGMEAAVITAIVLMITQQVDANFIQPKIIGTSFSISPILVIIGVTVGGSIGGVAGMIFAIPVVNVLKLGLEEYLLKKEKENLQETKTPKNESSGEAL